MKLCLVKILVLNLFISFLFSSTGAQAADNTIEIKQLPLNQNISHNDCDVYRWAENAVRDALTFGPENWREKIEFASRNFSTSGWSDFVDYMQKSYIFEFIEANQQTSKADVSYRECNGSKNENPLHIELLTKIVYESGKQKKQFDIIVNVTIETDFSDQGLRPQITSWNVKTAPND